MRDYFCGWYIKCQNSCQTVALIPAHHTTNHARSCSLQVISNEGVWKVEYPIEEYSEVCGQVKIGPNYFGRHGMKLNVQTPKLTLSGELTFSDFDPLNYDIMGPFRYVPLMQCRHSVFSMGHRVNGMLILNGKEVLFDNGDCYMEGDRGSSFPKSYLWTQCCFPQGSVMLSVADIPFCGLHFTGIISAIHYEGREYRLATYLGARLEKLGDGEAAIRQGRKNLTVRRLEDKFYPLAAPEKGAMTRIIRESAACRVYYRFCDGERMIFEFTSHRAAFEYEYPV
jgi:hypothetical protein